MFSSVGELREKKQSWVRRSLKKQRQVNELAQLVRTFAAKPDVPGSTPRTHIVKEGK